VSLINPDTPLGGSEFVRFSERNSKVGCIISTQHSVLTGGFIREFVLDDLSGAPFEMRPCLRKKPVR
jgi:hypothetical protein